MLQLNGQPFTLQQIADIASGREQVVLANDARARVERARRVVQDIVTQGRTVYGVNTGFGKLSDVSIDRADLIQLQLNLVRSHSCGLGEPLSEPEARAMLLLRANVLASGFSGARPLVIETLIAMLEKGLTPIIPEKGSVGASGDLAPLAHLALAAIGEGEIFYKGERLPAAAALLRELLQDSEIRQSHLINDPRVQDAYSLRCMPQVHGAIRTALDHAKHVVEIESGSATDNPLVFSETGDVLSGGNFHGAPLALVFDYAAIALTDLMSITERRIDRLVNPDSNEGLPPFLTAQPGISSGFMMLQVSAAALLNEARVLAHPASIDNVPTDGGKEDHVSMGMTSATKLRGIVKLAEMATAIELMTAAQGLEYHAPLTPGRGVKQAYEIVRGLVAPLTIDRSMSGDIEKLTAAIRRGDFELLN